MDSFNTLDGATQHFVNVLIKKTADEAARRAAEMAQQNLLTALAVWSSRVKAEMLYEANSAVVTIRINLGSHLLERGDKEAIMKALFGT
jgi:hypothetical protein